MAADKQDGLPGAVVGDYRIIRRLGAGGMGQVYLAHEQKLDRYVALKVLLPEYARDDSMVARLDREAKSAARLSHPHIVHVYAAGISQGLPYIAMEYVEGQTLADILRKRGYLDWREALHICSQVAKALDCAHRAGIIHRDIKPGNILVDKSGHIRVSDFGLAKLEFAKTQLTTSNAYLGTPQYMSPEHCGTGPLAPGSDLFSLGITLYQMLTGTLPFNGDTPISLVKKIAYDPPDAPPRELVPDVPAEVEALVMSLLEKDSARRPASAGELVARVSDLTSRPLPAPAGRDPRRDSSTVAAPWFQPEDAARRGDGEKRAHNRRTRLWVTGLVVLTVLAALAGVVFGLRSPSDETPNYEPAPPFPACRFNELAPGVLIARFVGGDLFDMDVHWAGSRPVALVIGRGRYGNAGGAAFLASLIPGDQKALILGKASDLGDVPRKDFFIQPQIPQTPSDSPLHGCLLIGLPEPAEPGAPEHIKVVAQKWDEARPRPEPLFCVTTQDKEAASVDCYHGRCKGAAICPDGKRICLVLTQSTNPNREFLAERKVRSDELGETDNLLTPAGYPIRRVRYSPNGKLLAYLRVEPSGGSELRVVPTGSRQAGGRQIALSRDGLIEFAFAPDSRRLVVSVPDKTKADNALGIVDLSRSDVAELRPLGPGRISSAPWHPSGKLLLALATDKNGTTQLVRINGAPPYEKTLVTERGFRMRQRWGVSGEPLPPVLSRDGKWMAARFTPSRLGGLVFIDITELTNFPVRPRGVDRGATDRRGPGIGPRRPGLRPRPE